MPIGRDPQAVLGLMPTLWERMGRAGRDKKSLQLSVFGCGPEREAVSRYAEAGFGRVIFVLPSENREAILPRLDKLAALM